MSKARINGIDQSQVVIENMAISLDTKGFSGTVLFRYDKDRLDEVEISMDNGKSWLSGSALHLALKMFIDRNPFVFQDMDVEVVERGSGSQ